MITNNEAYLVLITWPDGTEGQLFPRPGNVPIAGTLAQGLEDFLTAKRHMEEFREMAEKEVNGHALKKVKGATIHLAHFHYLETLETAHVD